MSSHAAALIPPKMLAVPFGEIVLADPERLRQLDPTILDN